jgi:hypothetical protein
VTNKSAVVMNLILSRFEDPLKRNYAVKACVFPFQGRIGCPMLLNG